MLNDNNQLVQKIADLIDLLSPAQKAIALTLSEIIVLALSEPPPAPPSASFTHSADGLTVTFTDTSLNTTGRIWSFGDGLTSTAATPTHVYSTNGTYCVTLTTVGEGGTMNAATLLLTIFGGGEPEQTAVTSGQLAWWKFRQAAGADTVVNAGSNGNADDLTPDDTGVTAGNSGPNGRADTAADSATTYWNGDATSSLLQSNDYTVAILVYKFAYTGYHTIIADGSGTFAAGLGTNTIFIEEDVDPLLTAVTHYGTTDAKQRALISPGWLAAFVVHDGATKTTAIYRDDGGVVQLAEDELPTAGTGTRVTTPAALTVGATADGNNKFASDIDDIRVYNRKLSEGEMNTILAEWGY